MKLKFTKAYGLFIPKLENRPMGVSLPLVDYTNGQPLPADQQILEVTEKEGLALLRQGHFEQVIEDVLPAGKKTAKAVAEVDASPIQETVDKEVENNC